jgi:hypothetical protein
VPFILPDSEPRVPLSPLAKLRLGLRSTLLRMRRAELQREVTAAVLPRLEPGEDVVGAAAVWVTTPRSTAQRILSARKLLPAAVTEKRLVLFRPPVKGKVPPTAIALEVPFVQVHVDGVSRLPLLQVRLRAARRREIVLEFRPRDRWLGRELAAIVEERRWAARPAPGPTPSPPTPRAARPPRPQPSERPDR